MNQEHYDNNRLEECPEIAPYFYDISSGTAARAYYNTSQFPERAGSIIRADYAKDMLNDLATVKKIVRRAQAYRATVAENVDELIAAWHDEHRAGLKSHYESYLHSHSNCASSFVCGPANFPVARMQKRMKWADQHYENIGAFRKKSKKRILRQVLPYGDGTAIRTDDPTAGDKVAGKIGDLERQREQMKAINKAYRKYYKRGQQPEEGDDKIGDCLAAMMAEGIDEPTAHELIRPNFMGDCTPFVGYQLTNLGAEIRRLKERAKDVEKVQAMEIDDTFPNGEKAYLSDDGKIVIEFGYKPEEEVRKVLKSHAFKWSRYRKAWVRKLTANAAAAYDYYIKPLLAGPETDPDVIEEAEAKTMDPEQELRELWTGEGVPEEKQDELVAAIEAQAQPGAQVGPFQLQADPVVESSKPTGKNYAATPGQYDLF